MFLNDNYIYILQLQIRSVLKSEIEFELLNNNKNEYEFLRRSDKVSQYSAEISCIRWTHQPTQE